MENNHKLPRNVWAMGLVSLFNDIASEMIYPIIPIFLKVVLGAPASVIGLIEGVAESTASLLKLVSGWISDHLKKRKIFVTIGYSLSGVSKLLLGFAHVWPFVLFARFIDRFGKGTRVAARDALILESVPPEKRGRAFGLHRSLDSLGAVVGTILSLALIAVFQDNYSTIFFLAFIPSVIGVLVLIIFVREKKKPIVTVVNEAAAPKKLNLKFKWKELDKNLKFFLIVSLIFAIGNSSDAFLILRAQDLGLTITLTVAAYVLYNISYSIFSYPIGVLSDKIGPKRILAASFWMFALIYLGLGLTQNNFWIWVLFPFYGLYMALNDGISRAYIGRTIDPSKSGAAFGAYQMITGLCVLGASVIAGALWSYINPQAPFFFGAGTALVAALLFSFKKDAVGKPNGEKIGQI
ncbi:TPA: MFS transporter [Candidatus Falkowbacteria bacterium]|nr:MAG: MFS transporter family protein [Candidatus Falkowbacteria bacterium GW2011_GWF2_43_32]HBA36537.1 MFS transporter [Candidatus Falkowbacteria bacterium]